MSHRGGNTFFTNFEQQLEKLVPTHELFNFVQYPLTYNQLEMQDGDTLEVHAEQIGGRS